MPATITVRQHDVSGNPQFGNGQVNYIADINAVAQIIGDILSVWQGSWWEDATIGVPYSQSILGGAPQGDVIPLVLQQQIQSAPYVQSITNVSVVSNPVDRSYYYNCTVQTSFGTVSVSGTTATSTANLGT